MTLKELVVISVACWGLGHAYSVGPHVGGAQAEAERTSNGKSLQPGDQTEAKSVQSRDQGEKTMAPQATRKPTQLPTQTGNFVATNLDNSTEQALLKFVKQAIEEGRSHSCAATNLPSIDLSTVAITGHKQHVEGTYKGQELLGHVLKLVVQSGTAPSIKPINFTMSLHATVDTPPTHMSMESITQPHDANIVPGCYLAERVMQAMANRSMSADEAKVAHKPVDTLTKSASLTQHETNAAEAAKLMATHEGAQQGTGDNSSWREHKAVAKVKFQYATGSLDHLVPKEAFPYTHLLGDVAVPESFDEITGTTCLDKYEARNQGGCGSCYAFASTTAVSISTCVLALRQGMTYPHGPPFFSTQDVTACGKHSNPFGTGAAQTQMTEAEKAEVAKNYVRGGGVSYSVNPPGYKQGQWKEPLRFLGSDKGPDVPTDPKWDAYLGGLDESYIFGCQGGHAFGTYHYWRDFGLPYDACNPYTAGDGGGSEIWGPMTIVDAICPSQCTPEFTAKYPDVGFTRFKVKDDEIYRMGGGEENMKRAILKYGAVEGSLMAYPDFSNCGADPDCVYEWDGVSGVGTEPGHAVVLYGWGTSSNGVPYWLGINSWGSDWGYGRKSLFKIRRGTNTAGVENEVWIAQLESFPGQSFKKERKKCEDKPEVGIVGVGSCAQALQDRNLQPNACVAEPPNSMYKGIVIRDCPATCKSCPEWMDAPYCELTKWSEWSACSVPCGGGQMTRTKSVLEEPEAGNSDTCPAADSAERLEVAECNIEECIPEPPAESDCVGSDWAEWRNNYEMADGVAKKRDAPLSPPAQSCQEMISGFMEKFLPGATCRRQLCEGCSFCPAKDCELEEWSEWSACTKECGGGEKLRTRAVKESAKNGGNCPASDDAERYKTAPCNTQGCPTNCELDTWSDWSTCTVYCGGGQMTRTKAVLVSATNGGTCPLDVSPERHESKACNTQGCPTNCELDAWSGWTECTEPCGGGEQSRTKAVLEPAKNGGTCPLEAGPERTESKACNTQGCPINCVLTPWSDWTACSKDCGGGFQTRERGVQTPAQNGGSCVGEWDGLRFEQRPCNQQACTGAPCIDNWGDFCANAMDWGFDPCAGFAASCMKHCGLC